MTPRVVCVTRPSPLDALLAVWGTRGQVAFALGSRGQRLDEVDAAHAAQVRALDALSRATPSAWRRARVDRADLDRFLFEPEDLVVAIGPDGLAANVAKYLDGQPLIGVNPDPDRVAGVLMRHAPRDLPELLHEAARGRLPLERRTLVEALTDDGQRLLALNEVYAGHRTHQSARYRLRHAGQEERHSSSGLIVSTGTGATGWARSIHQATRSALTLPRPEEPALVFFVREAWPGADTGCRLTEGRVEAGAALELVCEQSEGQVVFGDGLEADHIALRYGQSLRLRAADRHLHLAP